LIAEGLLTQTQVDEALQNQLLSGGTIGTSLLDLGYIDEDALGEALAGLLRVSYVSHDRLKHIPVHVIAQLPGSMAEKHQAIPIDFADRTLHVAAVHPKLLGSLSRLTGKRIVTWLAPEVRIYEALETYYGVAMRPRYVRIVKDLEARRENHERKLREMVAATVSTKAVLGPNVESSHIDVPEEYGYGRNWRAVAAELDGKEVSDGEEKEPEQRRAEVVPRRPVAEFRRIQDVLERFCDANYKEELFEAVLGYLSRSFETSIVFGVRNQLAHAWDYRSKKLTRSVVEKLRLPVGGGSIFSLLLGRTLYRGAPGKDDAAHPFYSVLKVDAPAEVLLLPVYVNDRLVTVVYADNGDKPIGKDTADYRLLAEKLSAAFNLLILKMKIRA
jgi:hypothetical protein